MVDGVTRALEFTSAWDVLNDIITSNVSDPLTGNEARSTTSDWVFNGFPNPAHLGKVGKWKFPIIVIRIPDIETETMSVDGTKFSITHTASIECYGRTRAEAATLAQDVKNQLETQTTELRKAAYHGPNILGTTEDSLFIGANKYYVKIVDYEFMRFD